MKKNINFNWYHYELIPCDLFNDNKLLFFNIDFNIRYLVCLLINQINNQPKRNKFGFQIILHKNFGKSN